MVHGGPGSLGVVLVLYISLSNNVKRQPSSTETMPHNRKSSKEVENAGHVAHSLRYF